MPDWGSKSLQKSPWRVLQLGGWGHRLLELGNYWTDPCNFQKTIVSFLRSDLCLPLLGAISHLREVLWSLSLRTPCTQETVRTRLWNRVKLNFSACRWAGPATTRILRACESAMRKHKKQHAMLSITLSYPYGKLSHNPQYTDKWLWQICLSSWNNNMPMKKWKSRVI